MSVSNGPHAGQAQPWPLAPLAATPQWILFKLVPAANGKTEKRPCHYITGEVCNAHDPAHWTTYDAAVQLAAARGPGWTVGFVITATDDFWCLDIDHALQPTGWSPLAQTLVAALPGCMVEISVRGTGLHVWGRHPKPPAHVKKRVDLGIELYTELRPIAIGTGQFGEIAPVCEVLPAFIAEWFPPRPAATAGEISDGPCEGWSGPTDDRALIDLALRYADERHGPFRDLWEFNGAALARRWPSLQSEGDGVDHSSADMSLACTLAYFTGRDGSRIERLMRESKLVRLKWDRADYLPRTIAEACKRTSRVLGDRDPAAAFAGVPVSASLPVRPALPDYRHRIHPGDWWSSARGLLEREFTHPGGDTLKHWQGEFYRWNGAAWRGQTEDDTIASCYRLLEKHSNNMFVPNRDSVGKFLHALKAAAHLDSTTAPPCWISDTPGPSPRELVPCGNGVLHLPTRALLPASPAFFSMNAVPYDYNPAAPPPRAWLEFLHQIFPDEPDEPDEPNVIEALQDMFGYMLTPDTKQQKLFLIIGPKRAGKGTLGRVLSALLGEDNVTSPSLSSLGTDFGLQPLVGKLAAIVSDARLGGRADPKAIAENLLRISGEDRVDVNRKFMPSLTLKLCARFLLLTNELPRLADASGAMASRFVIFKLRREFYGKEDHGLTDRLLGELPGILNWAIEGWQRLQARGHFVQPQSAAEDVEALADLGSPISAFLRDVCEVGPMAEVAIERLYQLWGAWCAEQGVERKSTLQVFGSDLRAALPTLKTTQPRQPAGKRSRVYRGVGVRPGTHWHAWPTIAHAGNPNFHPSPN